MCFIVCHWEQHKTLALRRGAQSGFSASLRAQRYKGTFAQRDKAEDLYPLHLCGSVPLSLNLSA
jgi:hypothetical protein